MSRVNKALMRILWLLTGSGFQAHYAAAVQASLVLIALVISCVNSLKPSLNHAIEFGTQTLVPAE